jgi:two-component system nitrogen regulation sensor histidine kinase NtrY
VSNLLAAVREGDYSIRGRHARLDDALGEVMLEINSLGSLLHEQRLGAVEATALLRRVMAEIDLAVFTFDEQHRLLLVNRAGQRLLARPAERLLGASAADLGLDSCLRGDPHRTIEVVFPGGQGRWGIGRSTFREEGLQHQLLVITDLSRTLREEERQAWQRLIRVLGHELNNSLAPIRSMSDTLNRLVTRDPLPGDWRDDVERGLLVIGDRAEALGRFIGAYSRLARLPSPKMQTFDVATWIRRVVELEARLAVETVPGPKLQVDGDPDQLEQLLINLLRNAVDVALETGGGVRVGWRRSGAHLEVWVEDEGPGLPDPANLFVPFFTTKPRGSGIGLVLCRQIAEAHNGTLSLENRSDAPGSIARLRLPL